MKKYFYYLRDAESTDPNLVVYKVSVGQSEREQAKYYLLDRYAADCGMFLRPIDDDSDFFLQKKAMEIFKGAFLPQLRFRRASVSVHQLFKMVMDDSFAAFEADLSVPHSHVTLLSTLIPSLYQISLPKKYHPVCKPEPRTYLSRLRENSFYNACFGMAIVAALFILQSIIDGLEASLY